MLLSLILMTATASAQKPHINFSVITQEPNFSGYSSFDECAAAVDRMIVHTENSEPLLRDTASFDPLWYTRSYHDSVSSTAKKCITPDMISRLPVEFAPDFAHTLLRVGYNDEALNILEKFLNSLPADSALKAAAGFLGSLVESRPIDLGFVDRFYNLARGYSSDSLDYNLISLEIVRWRIYDNINHPDANSVLAEMVRRNADIMKSGAIPAELRVMSSVVAFIITTRLYQDEIVDSLSVSTDAYTSILEVIWDSVSNGLDFNIPGQVAGKKFPVITSDYWFKSKAQPPYTSSSLSVSQGFAEIGQLVRPAPGRINLVVGFHGSCHRTTPVFSYGRSVELAYCEKLAAGIRRVMIAYPEVQLTIVSKTYGAVGNHVELVPEAEAALLAGYFFDYYRLPGVLAVESTPFFRINDPDGRRVDSPTPLTEALEAAEIKLGNGGMVLVDQDGKAIVSDMLNGKTETTLLKYIEALGKRK